MTGECEPDDETDRQHLIDRIESETRLCERLAEVGRGFGQAVTAADKQQNAMAALEAVIVYLNARKANIDCVKPLLALWSDIENLCDGNEVDFLIPQREGVQTRPSKSTIRDTVLASASALVEHLATRHGWDKPVAARRVARELEKRGHDVQSNRSLPTRDPAKQLRTYHAHLKAGDRPKNVRRHYEEMLDIISAIEPEEAITYVLDFVGAIGSRPDPEKLQVPF
jgi:hypothetical protein